MFFAAIPLLSGISPREQSCYTPQV